MVFLEYMKSKISIYLVFSKVSSEVFFFIFFKCSEFDKEDSSVTRSVVSFEKIIATSGLRVFEKERQKNFPEMGLYPVYTYALRPI